MPRRTIRIDYNADVTIKFCKKTRQRIIQIDTPRKEKVDKQGSGRSNNANN